MNETAREREARAQWTHLSRLFQRPHPAVRPFDLSDPQRVASTSAVGPDRRLGCLVRRDDPFPRAVGPVPPDRSRSRESNPLLIFRNGRVELSRILFCFSGECTAARTSGIGVDSEPRRFRGPVAAKGRWQRGEGVAVVVCQRLRSQECLPSLGGEDPLMRACREPRLPIA